MNTYLSLTHSPLQNFEALFLPNSIGLTEETFLVLKAQELTLVKVAALGLGAIISAIGVALFGSLKDYKTLRNVTAISTLLFTAGLFYQLLKMKKLVHEMEIVRVKNEQKIFNDICALFHRKLVEQDSIIISSINEKQLTTREEASKAIDIIACQYRLGKLYLDEKSTITEIFSNDQQPHTENEKICRLATKVLEGQRPACKIIPLWAKLEEVCRHLIVGKKGTYQILGPGEVKVTQNYVQLEQNPTTTFWEAKQFQPE